jgi:hypothetical protein
MNLVGHSAYGLENISVAFGIPSSFSKAPFFGRVIDLFDKKKCA